MNEQQPDEQESNTADASPRKQRPMIVVGIVIVAAVIFFVAWQFFAPETRTQNTGASVQQQFANTASTTTQEPISTTEYESAVSALIRRADVSNVSQAAQIHAQLLQLPVPASYLQLHLQLVDLFQDIQNGESVESLTQRLDTLQTTYPWLK